MPTNFLVREGFYLLVNKWMLCINGALWISSKSEIEREGLERERERGGGEEEDMVTSQKVTENL